MKVHIKDWDEAVGAALADSENWFVEDDNDKFAHKVCEILSDSELEKKIGTKAREFILENFSWNVAREQFEKLLGDK